MLRASILALLAIVPAAAQAATCPLPSEKPMVEVELFFGRDIPGGGRVSDADWADFTATVITPAFPDGFSVSDANGQWRDTESRRIVREPSEIVLIVAPRAAALAPKIRKIADAYRTRFHQQSVGIVTRPVCAAF
jgi:hypothetical protein